MDIKVSGEITLGFIKDIVDTVTYYKLQDATMDPPDTPTDETPTGWSTSEPEYDGETEQKLYSVTKTTFTDGSFSYSEVSMSSSFKAANQAFVKALLAKDTADAAAEEAGNASTAASAAQATANQAKTAAEGAAEDAATAQATANQAKTAAEDASKVATNFLSFEEGTGLIVGDMTEDTLGGNTLIGADGVSIRDGETELARFTSDTIEIGKASPNASIVMRQGDFGVYTGESTKTLTVPVELRVKDKSCRLYGKRTDPENSYHYDTSELLLDRYEFDEEYWGGTSGDDDDDVLVVGPIVPGGVSYNALERTAELRARVQDHTTPSGSKESELILSVVKETKTSDLSSDATLVADVIRIGEGYRTPIRFASETTLAGNLVRLNGDDYEIYNPDKFREALGIGTGDAVGELLPYPTKFQFTRVPTSSQGVRLTGRYDVYFNDLIEPGFYSGEMTCDRIQDHYDELRATYGTINSYTGYIHDSPYHVDFAYLGSHNSSTPVKPDLMRYLPEVVRVERTDEYYSPIDNLYHVTIKQTAITPKVLSDIANTGVTSNAYEDRFTRIGTYTYDPETDTRSDVTFEHWTGKWTFLLIGTRQQVIWLNTNSFTTITYMGITASSGAIQGCATQAVWVSPIGTVSRASMASSGTARLTLTNGARDPANTHNANVALSGSSATYNNLVTVEYVN